MSRSLLSTPFLNVQYKLKFFSPVLNHSIKPQGDRLSLTYVKGTGLAFQPGSVCASLAEAKRAASKPQVCVTWAGEENKKCLCALWWQFWVHIKHNTWQRVCLSQDTNIPYVYKQAVCLYCLGKFIGLMLFSWIFILFSLKLICFLC